MRWFSSVLALSAVLGFAACGGGGSPATQSKQVGVRGPSEVTAEPVSTAGRNPFMPSVGKDKKNVKPPKAAVTGSGPATYSARLPGLYGGTMNYATCDSHQLVTFLEANPAKAQAWAQALGIGVSDIRSYVSGLTAVTLRTDTRVTNHGYVNGVANPIQSVLEAGTAVLVNNYGEPVVKCYCGNPLGPPVTYTQPTYVGPLWAGFAPTHITIIQQSTTIINVFKLYDPSSGRIFLRPAGTDGTSDRPYHGPGGTPAPTPSPQTTPSGTQPAPQPQTQTQAPTQTSPSAPTENPSASFSPNPGQQGDNFVLSASGFQPGANLSVELTRPDGVVEHYTISVGSDGSGSHTFTNTANVITGTYTAVVTNPTTGASATTSVQVQPAGGGG